MRWNKILFIVFVVILLSSSAFAADKPTPRVSHADKRRALIKQTSGDYNAAGGYLRASMALGSLPFGMGVGASGIFMAASLVRFERAKAGRAQLREMRTTIWKRGWYSIYDIIDAYDDYSGINKYSALFFGEDWLAKRREMAADYFCEKTLLLGGKACWQSKLCEGFYNSREPPVGKSILIAQTAIGGYAPAVSIQGERSLPIVYKENGKSKRRYVYELTYFISNPHDRAMTYHIKLVGDAKEFTSPAMTIKRATEDEFFRVERLGNNPLISESENYYHTVCLTFSPRMIQTSGRLIGANRVSEICAPLVEYEGSATKPYTVVPGAEEGAAETPEASEEGATGYETNPLAGA